MHLELMNNKNNSLVSIILPVFNGQNYVSQTLDSCMNQTYSNWELIVVNDCSTDNTQQIIEKYSAIDTRIRVVNNKTNKKLPRSLNIGHRLAKGQLLTWISHDNIFEHTFLERMMYHLNTNNSDIIYSNFHIINNDGLIMGIRRLSNLNGILVGNPVQASFLYKKEVFQYLKGYDENLFLVEDYDFWLRASLNFRFSYCDEELYFFRKHDSSLTENINRDRGKFQEYTKALAMSFGKLNNNMFSETTVNLLVNLNSTDRQFSKLSAFKIIKYLNLVNDEIFVFEKQVGLPKDSCFIALIDKIKENIFNGNITISLFTLIFCIYKWPKKLLPKSNYNLKRLIRCYWLNPLRIC